MNTMDHADQVAHWMVGAHRGVVFTGAGISTESGIPDFRSPGGLWSRHAPVMYDEFLASRAARIRYWRVRNELYQICRNARPNAGHLVVAEWESRGLVEAVITQNIDGLHQDAGSRRVLELHGTNRIVACTSCRREWHPDDILTRIEAGDDAPDCDSCGAPLKSKTISFGQPMPDDVMAEALHRSKSADVFLVLGSSLVVEPAASLPRVAKASGARMVIVNAAPTPLDHLADVVIRDPIGATLTALNQLIPRDHHRLSNAAPAGFERPIPYSPSNGTTVIPNPP